MKDSTSKPNTYYLYENKRSTGPLTKEELEARYRAGQIDGDTFCCPATLCTILFGSSYARLSEFFPHFRSPSREKRHGEQGQREPGRERERQQIHTVVVFDCVECGSNLRLHLQQRNTVYRCPCCKTEYKTVQAGGQPPVLLVVPLTRHGTDSAGKSAKRHKTMSPEVRAALRVLALDEEPTFEHVRRAYREVVKQYHPDMVAHLGPELRKMAETKTKEINMAYRILERFYNT